MKSLSTESSILRNKKQILFNALAVFNFAFLIAISASFLLAEPSRSDAATVTASAGSSIYTASISNSDSVTIPITPTSSQTEYASNVNDSKVIFSSTCPKGAYVYINTSSSNNSLTRTGSDTGVKTINAVAGNTGLTDNTWGYKVSGNAFSTVPVSSSPAVLYASTGVESNTPINLQYGVKVDNNIPSGTYTNDVVYTVAVKPECLAYTLKFDTQGGSSISDASINYGDTVNLNNYTTTKSGYIFGGWSNGTNDFTGKETTANPNPSNNFTVTLSACWVKNTPYAYDYTGGEQTFTAPCNGYYKLEVWGAQGGNSKWMSLSQYAGGKGGYSSGNYYVSNSEQLYITVGSQGQSITTSSATAATPDSNIGYNGGGYAAFIDDNSAFAGGGGATHIATSSGLLKYLHANKSTVLIVAGGGGGSASYFKLFNNMAYWTGNGGSGGGEKGENGIPSVSDKCHYYGIGGTQTSADSGDSAQVPPPTAGFGYGQDYTKYSTYERDGAVTYAGGGGGFYGGSAGHHCPGGGGSGYTGGVLNGSTASGQRSGNGAAKITYLGTTI